MESFNDKNVYAVVEFATSELDDKKDIDIVPSTWIVEENNQLLCKYPSPEDYQKLDKYVQELSDPMENWAKYPVKILSYADSYAKGKRRLKRAFKTTAVRSTDDENTQHGMKPTIISNKVISKELKSISAMNDMAASSSTTTADKHTKSKMDTPSEILRPIAEVNEGFDFESLKEFINTKINEQTILFHRYLTNEKKSLQYDLKKYFEEIKNTLLVNNVPLASHQSVSSATETLDVALPLKELDDFKNFDLELKTTDSKRKALLMLFRVKIYGENAAKGCISKMASALLTKNVEKHYSGTGKVVKGVGKLNFSATETFQCMKEVVMEKFGDSEECKNFAGKVGRWLSGQGDKDHGRKQRALSV